MRFSAVLTSRLLCLPILTATAFTPLRFNAQSSASNNYLRRKAHQQLQRKMSLDSDVIPGRPTWHQTMLRIKSKESVQFYEKLGFTLIDSFDFPQYNFSLFFMASLPEDETYDLTPGTQAAHDYLWTIEGTALELTYNHGSEVDDNVVYHPGNKEKDGFGHIAVRVKDVYKTSEQLEKDGVAFQKRPDEGRMKGLAFAKDLDGYWIEIIKRGEKATFQNEYNFAQTMLRIKDPKKSIPFYQKLGMKVLKEKHFDDFSLYFMVGNSVPDDTDDSDLFQPVLELTHNHGTENDPEFKHYNGNEDGRQGFGHIGFLVDDVYAACDALRPLGYGFRKEPDGGSMKGLAFAYDPDGYSVEIIKRGGIDFGDKRKD